MDKFIDRQDAGAALAKLLNPYAKSENAIVLALPRGGVPVAYEISQALGLPLDIFIVRKLGVPNHEELAMGAIASGGTVIFNQPVLNELKINNTTIETVLTAEKEELSRREKLYRGDRPFPILNRKAIILVDDGIATGSTIKAAIKALKAHRPEKIIIAVPVSEKETCQEIARLCDQIICPLRPIDFVAVGLWYEEFPQVSDKTVIELLNTP